MPILFLIPIVFSIAGIIYKPSIESLVATIVIAFISSPLAVLRKVHNPDEGILKRISLKFLLIVAILIGTWNLMVVAVSTGRSGTEIFSLEGVMEIAVLSTINRYEIDPLANSGNPLLLAISLFIVFVAKIVDRGVAKTLISLAPIVFYSILSTEKWPSFLAVIFLIAGNEFSLGHYGRRNVAKIVLVLLVIAVLMLISLMLRSGSVDLLDLIRSFGNYLFPQYYGLGHWLMGHENKGLQFGVQTFMGPLNQLGFYRREAGAGFESYTLYGMESNIYTAYKYLIMDFGILGSFLLNFTWIVLVAVIRGYYSKRIATGIYAFLYFCTLLSSNVTPFVHNSTALAIAMSVLFVMIIQKKSVVYK